LNHVETSSESCQTPGHCEATASSNKEKGSIR
jgi:hypothetical protein